MNRIQLEQLMMDGRAVYVSHRDYGRGRVERVEPMPPIRIGRLVGGKGTWVHVVREDGARDCWSLRSVKLVSEGEKVAMANNKSTHLTPEERALLRELADKVRLSEILVVLGSIARHDLKDREEGGEASHKILSVATYVREVEGNSKGLTASRIEELLEAEVGETGNAKVVDNDLYIQREENTGWMFHGAVEDVTAAKEVIYYWFTR